MQCWSSLPSRNHQTPHGPGVCKQSPETFVRSITIHNPHFCPSAPKRRTLCIFSGSNTKHKKNTSFVFIRCLYWSRMSDPALVRTQSFVVLLLLSLFHFLYKIPPINSFLPRLKAANRNMIIFQNVAKNWTKNTFMKWTNPNTNHKKCVLNVFCGLRICVTYNRLLWYMLRLLIKTLSNSLVWIERWLSEYNLMCIIYVTRMSLHYNTEIIDKWFKGNIF